MELFIIKCITCGIVVIAMIIMIVIITEPALKTPPKAIFFKKVKGKETLIEGPYEEQYLTYRERRLWRKQKRK